MHFTHRSAAETLFHTPAMWRVRQSPRIHAAFASLWRTARLWISLDRTMLKAPSCGPDHPGSDLLHWDFDVREETERFQLYQATLFLEDCAVDQGTFQCVPGFHQKYVSWRAAADMGAPTGTRRAASQTLQPAERWWYEQLRCARHSNPRRGRRHPRGARWPSALPAAARAARRSAST